jgi:hypothetical protein
MCITATTVETNHVKIFTHVLRFCRICICARLDTQNIMSCWNMNVFTTYIYMKFHIRSYNNNYKYEVVLFT